MGLPAETERGINYAKSHTPEEKKKLINWVKVAPAVPIHIIYYTLWYDKQGNVTKWPDIYAYDQLILNHLQTYLP
jgi:murein L,D-transpeptidase YcbB/YkuD